MAIVHTIERDGVKYSFEQIQADPGGAHIRIIAPDRSSPGAFDLIKTTTGWGTTLALHCADENLTEALAATFRAAFNAGKVVLR